MKDYFSSYAYFFINICKSYIINFKKYVIMVQVTHPLDPPPPYLTVSVAKVDFPGTFIPTTPAPWHTKQYVIQCIAQYKGIPMLVNFHKESK